MNATQTPELQAIQASLADPFDPKEVRFKPQMVKSNRALAMAYIDARLVQERLDAVLGVENWQDGYEFLPDGSVVCRLRLRLGGKWVAKTDVGSPSEQPDSGDRVKAAVSDALKRAAVKFGVGRYLYRIPSQWVDYDPAKKQLTQVPQLPAFALPAKQRPAAKGTAPQQQPAKPAAAAPTQKPAGPKPPEQPKPPTAALPATGQELHRRLQEYDAKLAAQKLCGRGALLAHVVEAGVRAGYTANMTDWTGPALAFAVDVVKEFEQTVRRPAAGAKADPVADRAAALERFQQACDDADQSAESLTHYHAAEMGWPAGRPPAVDKLTTAELLRLAGLVRTNLQRA
ncbi:Rad52/Rad22 family DNA repair protein [Gemmata sp.]|uniref:Rad52/Rad22 family DNA repair protein n=1 Tax=Gemmata sp. TaxID=1914242 RepID=UPI003F71EF8D